jgi:hypothetical protein
MDLLDSATETGKCRVMDFALSMFADLCPAPDSNDRPVFGTEKTTPGQRDGSRRLAYSNPKRGEQGIALIAVLIITTLLLGLIGGTLLFTQIDLRISSNLKTGSEAFSIAEAGLYHSIAKIPSGHNFSLPPSGFPFQRNFPPGGTSTYTVTATNDDTDPNPNVDTNERIILTATGAGLDGSKRVIRAYIGRGPAFVPPGTVYVPGTDVDKDFDGTSFLVSGNDTNPDGSSGPNAAVPGISTSNDGVTASVADNLLDAGQQNEVIGQGGLPSVLTTSDPMDPVQIATDLLAFPHLTLAGGAYSGTETFGTTLAPQITYITGNVRLQGNSSGVGVLIIDGSVTLSGNFSFQGLIIALGASTFQAREASMIHGAIMIKPSNTSDADEEIEVGGNSSLYYSSQALAMVNNNWEPALPKPAILLSWLEQLN